MIHIANLTDKEHGTVSLFLGSRDACQAHADRNADRFAAEIRPATRSDIEARIAILEDRRLSAKRDRDYGPWLMTPKYEARLAEIDRALARLTAALVTKGRAA